MTTKIKGKASRRTPEQVVSQPTVPGAGSRPIEGTLYVGHNRSTVLITPEQPIDKAIWFTPAEARHFANVLRWHADGVEIDQSAPDGAEAGGTTAVKKRNASAGRKSGSPQKAKP